MSRPGDDSPPADPTSGPSPGQLPLRDAAKTWFAISWQTFGGPAGQIAVMQRALVDEKRWIGQRRFLHALNYCMLLPGPEAQQLAIYTGWLLNGVAGGLIAGVLFVLPGMITILALSMAYVGLGDSAFLDGVFLGVAPAVIAVVVQAVARVSGRALTHPSLVVVAVLAFAALTFFAVPFPAVILAAAIAGWAMGRRWPSLAATRPDAATGPAPLIGDDVLHHERPSLGRAGTVLAIGVAAWGVPVGAAALALGPDSVIVQQALFFTGVALVTFGGAYAVLSYVTQQAVGVYGWVTPQEMVRGLALAETTPGPLIMVVQFVAFLGAYHDPGTLNPWAAGITASLLTTWVTFVPSFLFVFLGAPHVEQLRHNHALTAALTGVTAAVVGVIANLAVYFAVHTLFAATRTIDAGPATLTVPEPGSVLWGEVAVAALASALIFWRRWGVLPTLGVCAVAGLVVHQALSIS